MGTYETHAEIAEYTAQVRRILDSATFQESPLLRLFLEFVTTEALSGSSDNISEYTIATRVLGRGDDFDPSSATVVRTQAYRLRRKLAEYYATDGAGDNILVEIPKGHYYPAFSRREPNVATAIAHPVSGSAFSRKTVVFVLVALGMGVVLGILISSRGATPGKQVLLPTHLSQLWGEIAQHGQPVVVAFANPGYLVSNSGDLFNPGGTLRGVRGERVPGDLPRAQLRQNAPLYFEDGYTGTGEVFAMNRLTSLLERSGVSVIVKRNATLTVEDLRSHDVVFVGAGVRVQALHNTKLLKRFQIQPAPRGSGPWNMRILDYAAPAGGPRSYAVQRDPATQELKGDYAILAVVPGVIPSRRILLIAGLTTSGTQGAAEYATSEHHLERLAAALSPKSGDRVELPRYFEAVLRIDVAKGLDAVNTTFVTGAPIVSNH